MSDPYSSLASEELEVQSRIADTMAARCIDPAQVELRRAYLSSLNLPVDSFAVEFGSGTGHVTKILIDMAGATWALGIEPSGVMVDRALAPFQESGLC